VTSVFFISHEWYDGEYDHITDIAVYSSLSKAENALEKLKHNSKFINNKDGFTIDEYIIDEDEWKEGFFTYSE